MMKKRKGSVVDILPSMIMVIAATLIRLIQPSDHYHSILRVFGCYYEPNRKTLERIMHGLVH